VGRSLPKGVTTPMPVTTMRLSLIRYFSAPT